MVVVNNIVNFTRADGRPQLPQTVWNPDQEQPVGAEGYSEDQQDHPTEIDIWNVILSFKESFGLLKQYLRYKLNVDVRSHDVGSLLITVECSSLQILEGLWEDYCSGHLNEITQEVLVTPQVLEKLGLTDVKLKTYISEEEYEKGKQIFMDNSGSCVMEGMNPLQHARHLGMMAKRAMQLRDYHEALRMLSTGLAQLQSCSPQFSGPFLLDRAECLWQLGNVQASLHDMENALRFGLPKGDFVHEEEAERWKVREINF
ncbi:Death effector [Desmophyllum pertusum]|uniref:Death effector n=1 Tax=Desmophyllum pertusum TaxID=174260 RepID=A0A9X0CQB3_9CNID|nr:Death effector [Desmophyllum pertusum]